VSLQHACAIANPDSQKCRDEIERLHAENEELQQRLSAEGCITTTSSDQPAAELQLQLVVEENTGLKQGVASLQEENRKLVASLLTARGHLENLQIQVANHVCFPACSAPPSAQSTPPLEPSQPPHQLGDQGRNTRSAAERIMTDIETRDPGIISRIEDGMFSASYFPQPPPGS